MRLLLYTLSLQHEASKQQTATIMGVKEALQDVNNGASIACGGFGLCGFPFELFTELHRRKVKDLTLAGLTMAGEGKGGIGSLVQAQQLRKIITTYVGENKPLVDAFLKGEFEVEFCPMGTLIDRMRAGGAGIPAFYTPTGYGTAVATGELPARFAPDGTVVQYSKPRETRLLDGRWCTFETALRTDFAFVRAWKADKRGNIVFRGTTRNLNTMAAKCARVCIAEVEEIVECGELDPNEIHLPSVYVNRLVKPDNIRKEAESVVTRNLDGSINRKNGGEPANDGKHRIARRAALEIRKGMYLNLGVGVPNYVANYIRPEMGVMLQCENGLLGMGPYPLPDEVDCDLTNAGKQTITMIKDGASLFDSHESFTMIRGGHMDLTMLGALQISATGDIASWYVPGKIIKGMGGAMDLVQSGCKIIVLMEHVCKSGQSRIVNKCSIPLTGKGMVDMIITDLATFRIEKAKNSMNKLWLTELAEGISLEEVKAKTVAHFEVSKDLKTMPLVKAV